MNDPGSTAACGLASPLQPTLSVAEALRRFDREAQRGVCDTGRYRCRYSAWGDGPTLVLVPGLASDARSFALLASRLMRHFRVVVYDLPTGRGDGANLGRYRHADLTADFFALLDHLNAQQAYVSGFSFGSTIALAALHTRPERLPRAVLQSGFARRPLAPAEILLARLTRHWQAPLAAMPARSMLLRWTHSAPFAGQPPELWQFFVERNGVSPVAAAAHRALLVHGLDLRPLLARIRQPVLLVSGDADPLVNAACMEELRHGLPNAAHIELRDCGHHALFTHPTQLAEAMRQFLLPPPCHAE